MLAILHYQNNFVRHPLLYNWAIIRQPYANSTKAMPFGQDFYIIIGHYARHSWSLPRRFARVMAAY
jgi:hypothetical protein